MIALIIHLILLLTPTQVPAQIFRAPEVLVTPRVDAVYPDKKYTPGTMIADLTKDQICKVGYTKDARHVTAAVKRQVMMQYNLDPKDLPKYEIDHFISLELGGSNDVTNLWPQRYCPVGNDPLKTGCWGAREKDKVETALHREICQNLITLEQAQAIIRTDWVQCYKSVKNGKNCIVLN